MSTPQITDFLIDDDNIDKMWEHGIRPEQVLQLLDNEPKKRLNRRNQRGLYLVVGRDNGGACIAIPVEPTHEPGLWRPITAWPCKKVEEGWL